MNLDKLDDPNARTPITVMEEVLQVLLMAVFTDPMLRPLTDDEYASVTEGTVSQLLFGKPRSQLTDEQETEGENFALRLSAMMLSEVLSIPNHGQS